MRSTTGAGGGAATAGGRAASAPTSFDSASSRAASSSRRLSQRRLVLDQLLAEPDPFAAAAMGDGAGLGVEADEAVVARLDGIATARLDLVARRGPGQNEGGENDRTTAHCAALPMTTWAPNPFSTNLPFDSACPAGTAPIRSDKGEARMATIYKICPETLWREAEAAGVIHGSPVDLQRRLYPLLDRRAGGRDGEATFCRRGRPCSRRRRRGRSGRAPLRAVARRGALPASLRSLAPAVHLGQPFAARADGRHRFPIFRHDPPLRAAPGRFSSRLEPEPAHRPGARRARGGLSTRAPGADPRLRRRVLGLDFPNPLGLAAGFDKNAAVPTRCSGSASASSRSAP